MPPDEIPTTNQIPTFLVGKKILLGNQGTREPGNLKLFFSSEFWWKNPRKCSLRSLFSRVLSQQNGELKKLLEIPVPWFPGSLASVKHAREFCYAESKTAAPLVLLTSASRGVLPRDTAIIEGC